MKDIDADISFLSPRQQGEVECFWNKTRTEIHDPISLALAITALCERKPKIRGSAFGYMRRMYEGIHRDRLRKQHEEMKKQEPQGVGAILAKMVEGKKCTER